MRQIAIFLFSLAGLALSLSGCNSQPTPSSSPSDPAADVHGGDQQSSDMDAMKAELAKLSPEGRASAEKQHICPVSGKMLGTMGVPQKVDVSGKQVWICCPGCKDQLLENPGDYLSKLQQE